jgi:large subunit ribosomal protein L18
LSSDPEAYKLKFSRFLAQGVPPEKLPEHFEKVKKEIVDSFRTEGKKK